MGLDIYFIKRKKRQGNSNEDFDDGQKELAYFRKVNCLVAFFEDNYDYDRESWDMEITKDMCRHLLDNCASVLEDNDLARELMPTAPGFFFGSTDYDEYYFDDLESIIEAISENVLPEFDDLRDDEVITFCTSW